MGKYPTNKKYIFKTVLFLPLDCIHPTDQAMLGDVSVCIFKQNLHQG